MTCAELTEVLVAAGAASRYTINANRFQAEKAKQCTESIVVLLMEETLHHLKCSKSWE